MKSELQQKFYKGFAESRKKEFMDYVMKSDSAHELIEEVLGHYLFDNDSDMRKDIAVANLNASVYNPNTTWADKIILSIKNNNKSTTPSEIVDFVLKNEPKLDRAKVAQAIQVEISRIVGKKILRFGNKGAYTYNTLDRINVNDSEKLVKVMHNTIVYDPNEYNPNANWIDKIKYFIKIKGGSASPREIAEQFNLHEHIDNKEERNKKIDSMMQILRQHSKKIDGEITRISDGGNSFIYRLTQKVRMAA